MILHDCSHPHNTRTGDHIHRTLTRLGNRKTIFCIDGNDFKYVLQAEAHVLTTHNTSYEEVIEFVRTLPLYVD